MFNPSSLKNDTLPPANLSTTTNVLKRGEDLANLLCEGADCASRWKKKCNDEKMILAEEIKNNQKYAFEEQYVKMIEERDKRNADCESRYGTLLEENSTIKNTLSKLLEENSTIKKTITISNDRTFVLTVVMAIIYTFLILYLCYSVNVALNLRLSISITDLEIKNKVTKLLQDIIVICFYTLAINLLLLILYSMYGSTLSKALLLLATIGASASYLLLMNKMLEAHFLLRSSKLQVASPFLQMYDSMKVYAYNVVILVFFMCYNVIDLVYLKNLVAKSATVSLKTSYYAFKVLMVLLVVGLLCYFVYTITTTFLNKLNSNSVYETSEKLSCSQCKEVLKRYNIESQSDYRKWALSNHPDVATEFNATEYYLVSGCAQKVFKGKTSLC